MLIELDKIIDPRGNLTVAQGHDKVPFDIRRAYWVYDVPGGESRGGHAHKQCREFIVAVLRPFSETLDHRPAPSPYLLTPPRQALLLGTGV